MASTLWAAALHPRTLHPLPCPPKVNNPCAIQLASTLPIMFSLGCIERLRLHLTQPAVRSYYPSRCAIGFTACPRPLAHAMQPTRVMPAGSRFPAGMAFSLSVVTTRRASIPPTLRGPFRFAALRNSSRQPGYACGTPRTRFGGKTVRY